MSYHNIDIEKESTETAKTDAIKTTITTTTSILSEQTIRGFE